MENWSLISGLKCNLSGCNQFHFKIIFHFNFWQIYCFRGLQPGGNFINAKCQCLKCQTPELTIPKSKYWTPKSWIVLMCMCETPKMTISTSLWSVQHPNAGRNIQKPTLELIFFKWTPDLHSRIQFSNFSQSWETRRIVATKSIDIFNWLKN